jgi:hypothetical protein
MQTYRNTVVRLPLVLALFVVALCFASQVQAQRSDKLKTVASEAVGRDVAIRHVPSTVLRFDLNSDTMWLDTFTFDIVNGFPRRNSWRPIDDVAAFANFTHELGHAAKGIIDDPTYTGPDSGPQDPTELYAERWAQQNRYHIARLLGFGPRAAKELSRKATAWSLQHWGEGFAQG